MMSSILLDPSFYILLSFFCLICVVVARLKNKLVFYLQKKIDVISTEINHAVCEKDEALLAYTRATGLISHLSEDIERVCSEAVVDQSELEMRGGCDLEKEIRLNAVKLVHLKKRIIHKEYDQVLDCLKAQFQGDLLCASAQQRSVLVDQFVDLLKTVKLDRPL